MKYEKTSSRTKKAIADSLKKFMEKKPLSKITVSEIVADCGINRKTFYYHFEDIQNLMKWILEQETVEVLKNFDLLLDYEDVISYILDYIEQNKHILNCAYDSMGRDVLKNFFYNSLNGMIAELISRLEEIMGCFLSQKYKRFVADFYTEALAGQIIELLKNKQPYDKEEIIQYLVQTIKSSLPAIIRENEKTC